MKRAKTESSKRPVRPPLTPEGNESLMISMAMDLAKKQLEEGTASSQVITHFLKLGSTKAELELAKLRNENELLRAKTEAIESGQRDEELLEKAIKAMRDYRGMGDEEDYDY